AGQPSTMPVAATRIARLSLLQLELPGSAGTNAGVLLEDPETDRLYVRLRRDWAHIAPEESEVLDELEADLAAKAVELGAKQLAAYMHDALSNVLQITEAREIIVEDFDRALKRLYRQHVDSTVQRFLTHIPRYSLAVAAGKFLENQEIS